MQRLFALISACSLTLAVACDGGPSGVDDPGGNYGIDDATKFGSGGAVGKEDNAGVTGPPTSADNLDTQVWAVRNQWEDRETAEAKLAGLAWGASSGLNWDEKYAAWVQSMQVTTSSGGYYTYNTFTVTTPYGKTMPAPALECSETAIFLRVAFASWYGLPFYMTAVDGGGTRMYFGHLGARTKTGAYKGTPPYKTWYKDYTSTMAGKTTEYVVANWPKDTKLRERGLTPNDDVMDWLTGTGAKRAGHYFDELFLNKRVGHLLRLMLDFFGSMNISDSRNTFNLKPQALKAGDVLVERWQRSGIGHVLVVKQVDELENGRKNGHLASGSMPRRQPKWEDSTAAKNYFTSQYCGGSEVGTDGVAYSHLGGGIKRWRVAKKSNGSWLNTWMSADEASWICDTDYARIEARIDEFEQLLGEVSPEALRTELERMIGDARNHLRAYPASCSARTRREDAFRKLYGLMLQHFATSAADTDRQYRVFEDYVFAELEYAQSKTCCWNSTTAAMHDIAVDYANSLQVEGTCSEPPVFKAMGGGYQQFATYAQQTGRASQWKAWSEDEPCAQRDVDNDTEKAHEWIPWCEASQGGGQTQGCASDDAYEPNDSAASAPALFEGTYANLAVCGESQDYFTVTLPAGGSLRVRIEFTHARGDLDMKVFRGGVEVGSSAGTSDVEEVTAATAGTYVVQVFGYSGAANTYKLVIEL